MPSSEEVTGTEAATATATMGRQATSTNPPVITDLPTEILLKIFEEFCLHCRPGGYTLVNGESLERLCFYHRYDLESRVVKHFRSSPPQPREPVGIRTLKSLAETCQRFCSITQPILYHAIHLDRDQTKTLGISNTLLDNSRGLGLAVKSLCVDYPWGINEDSDYEDYEDGATTRMVDVTRILTLAPKVKNIFLILPPGRLFELNDEITVVERQLEDRNIKSLTILSDMVSGYSRVAEAEYEDLQTLCRGLDSVSLDNAVPLLKVAASTLRSLAVSASIRVSESFALSLGRQTLQEPAPLQNISELVLWQSHLVDSGGDHGLNLDQIRNLLRAIGPNLASLVISTQLSMSVLGPTGDLVRGSYYEVMLQELLIQLLPWKNTLRKLVFGDMRSSTIRGVDFDDEVFNKISSNDRVGVLGEFVALETLAIRDDDYFHSGQSESGDRHLHPVDGPTFVSALSPRFKTLVLMGTVDSIFSVLDSLLHSYRAGNLPKLANIGINWVNGFNSQDLTARLQCIQLAFLEEGVNFSSGFEISGDRKELDRWRREIHDMVK